MKKIVQKSDLFGYEFRDLSENAQNKAINNHILFWVEVKEYDSERPGNYEKAVDASEENKTPWFLASYIYDFCKEQIIQEIIINELLFDKEGNMLPITYFDNGEKVMLNLTSSCFTSQSRMEVQLI